MALRILLQCLYYPPEVGGLESHVAGLAEGLARRGHEVHMLTSRSRGDLPWREVRAGVQLRRVWMPGKTPAGWVAHTLGTVPIHAALARRADVVHAHTFASGVPPWLTSSGRHRPYVLTLHTSHFLMRAQRSLWRPVLRRIIRRADVLLATSEEIREVALRLYPHPRSDVMTNAVDTERFRPAEVPFSSARRRVIVPRRLYPKNGVEYFVRAMPGVLRRADVEAVVVGDGPERGRLERLAAELGVGDRIRFLGARANAEMPDLLRAAELAVIPSLMEATSIAALEAMACGLPVAASAVGGLPEIIDREVGALFQPGDPEALAGAVVGLLERSDLSELGRKARRRVVANWSLDRMVERHLEIYDELVNEGQRKRR